MYVKIGRGCPIDAVQSTPHSDKVHKVFFFMRSAPEPLCCSAAGRFAVVISLSHVLGDGFTYYRIYGALDQREKEIGQAWDQR